MGVGSCGVDEGFRGWSRLVEVSERTENKKFEKESVGCK